MSTAKTDKFQSKGKFILASIGAAVGLGNALRFPGMCAKYGGGAFLFIYAVALLVLGLPILNAEIALGRKFGGGAPKCLSSVHLLGGSTNKTSLFFKKRSLISTPFKTSLFSRAGESTGWSSCINSLLTALIYAGLAGWLIAAAVTVTPLCINSIDMTRAEVGAYFFDGILNAREDGVISGVSVFVAVCIMLALAAIFFCVKGGAATISKAAKFTVCVPIVLLSALALRGLFYGNAAQALAALFIPDFTRLSSPELWLSALGQVFFSLSIVVGIMPAYGSYLPEGTNIVRCTAAIAAADFLVSVLASVVMFTTLYGCGLQNEIGASGIITAFSIYPVAVTGLFGNNAALNAAVGTLFYFSLAMMAIQSAASMLEAFVKPYSRRRGKSKKSIALKILLIAAPVTVIFATTAAPTVVDVSDRFVNFYNVLILGIAECLILSKRGATSALTDEINRFTCKLKMPKTFFCISVKYLCPAVLAALFVCEIVRLCAGGLGYPLWLQLGFGWFLSFAVFVCPTFLIRKRND